ncbi:MAG: staygreen family protein [Peptostreptococcaceae bacterium]
MSDLKVKIIEPIGSTDPILFRRYTLMKNTNMCEDILVISNEYKLNETEFIPILKDEFCGQWVIVSENKYILTCFANVCSDCYKSAQQSYSRLLEYLPYNLQSIISSDKLFIQSNPHLLASHISMRFISTYPEFNKTIYYCKVKDLI